VRYPEALIPTSAASRARLVEERTAFKARLAQLDAPALWTRFRGMVAAVLAGGGARGAYEAGALLAIQDAGIPTPLITATSIGAINGASYAAHATGLVGNAEPLVDAWFDLTPPAVGVEWTRYAWMVGGLLATFAGIVNLTYYELSNSGYPIHLHHPALAWISLCLAGASVLFFYDQIPYLYFVLRRLTRGSRWRPSRRRLAVSAGANALVLLFAAAVVESLDAHTEFGTLVLGEPLLVLGILLGLILLQRARRRVHPRVGRLWGRLLRLPFRTGIFSNFERTRFLRGWIPAERLRASAIKVVLTATELDTGAMRCFTNADPASFLGRSGVDDVFATGSLVRLDDLMPAVIASSALPIAYEPLVLGGRLMADGAIVGSQPFRPAIRLGADVLLLISMEAPGGSGGPVRTFVDVGLRALDILMQQNMQRDISLLAQANKQIEEAARVAGMRPEDLVIEFEGARFRYVKSFAIRPETPIDSTILEFGGRATEETIVRGYRDAVRQIEAFAEYARTTEGFSAERRLLQIAVADPRLARASLAQRVDGTSAISEAKQQRP
jgi:predicted acylesterase/phospholipase RssA